MESYRRIKAPTDKIISPHESSSTQEWLTPLCGWYTVNVDTAIRSLNQTAGLRWLLETKTGRL